MEGMGKKIYFDISIMNQLLFFTGIQRVVKEIVIQLDSYANLDLVFLDYDYKKGAFAIIPRNQFIKYLNEKKYDKFNVKKEGFIKPEQIEKGAIFFELDATWMCRIKRSYLYPLLKRNGVILVVHIYDVICITHPYFFEEELVRKFMDYIGAALLYADKIICNAAATCDDIKFLSDTLGIPCPRISIVPLGADFVDTGINGFKVSREIVEAVEGKKYILMVGTIEPRKNHKLLLDAYEAGLKDLGYSIIFAGSPGWKNKEFMSRLTSHSDYGKRLFLFSKQPDQVIDYLYNNAQYAAFLSYKEGYGLPIIEAMAKGVPVIASDTLINREIGGNYCIYFKQDDCVGLYSTIGRISDEKYRSICERLKNFSYCSWNVSAAKMLEAITEL